MSSRDLRDLKYRRIGATNLYMDYSWHGGIIHGIDRIQTPREAISPISQTPSTSTNPLPDGSPLPILSPHIVGDPDPRGRVE